MILGQGSYGEVSIRDGKAIKKFSKLSHLIQEYMALQYVKDCKYVVHSKGVDFNNLELHMELYDCSLRKWLEDKRDKDKLKSQDIMTILHDILMGLMEFHDREFAHGDIKPGNILIKKTPLRAVLGDCGFVSIKKYAKVDRTAAIYRDPVINHDLSHDMFSFGICFLEMVGDIKINRQATYSELKQVSKDKIDDRDHCKIIYNLLHEDRSRRPSARKLLFRLFKVDPPKWIRPNIIVNDTYKLVQKPHTTTHRSSRIITSVSQDDRTLIRQFMKKISNKYNINRGKKGYGAIISFLDNNKIEPFNYLIYTAVTLMILSAIFGKSGFREHEVMEFCEQHYNKSFIYKILEDLLSDDVFVSLLLTP